MNKRLTRREFLATSTVGAATVAALPRARSAPAITGGEPVRTAPFPAWPVWDESDEKSLFPVLRAGGWSRGRTVDEFEKQFAELMGAERCVSTTNGTNALITSVRALGIGAGDEVITTPYTFVASIHPILLAGALPVFADIDPGTWQIDPGRIEKKITPNTVAIMPVHIVGGICDMDRILAIARKHSLKVIEDACEAHFGEWKGRKAGAIGDLGCFSFQTGKALTCGEGGAILGADENLMDLCYSIHNLGRPRGKKMPRDRGGYPIVASKCRMAEYQAAMLLSQMRRAAGQVRTRSENAAYLTARLREIPGIVPRQDYPGVTQTAFYYYGFRYRSEIFDGLSRDKFIAALGAEGIPASKGLGVIDSLPMNKEGLLEDAFRSKAFQKVYGREKLADYHAQNECPQSDLLCTETVGFHHRMLLGGRKDAEDICRAIEKVYENRSRLL